MTPNAAGKTALEGEERDGEELSEWRGSEAGGVAAARTPRRGRGASGRLDDESTGAVLERELLLVQPPSRPRPALRLGRLLRTVGIVAVLLAAGGGIAWGVLELRRSWQASLDDLQTRLDRLSADNARQASVVVALRRENENEARARQAENRELADLMQKTLLELESTVGRLQELRAEKDALEARYEQLRKATETGSLERFLERLVPRWLVAPQADR